MLIARYQINEVELLLSPKVLISHERDVDPTEILVLLVGWVVDQNPSSPSWMSSSLMGTHNHEDSESGHKIGQFIE